LLKFKRRFGAWFEDFVVRTMKVDYAIM